jgi:uncharacterized repeat protein (TIGR01451 family)
MPSLVLRRVARRLRARRPALLLLPIALMLLGAALAGCGSSQSQLTVTLSAATNDSAKPGNLVGYTLEVDNQGPGDATGVRAALDLPTGFSYQTTPKIAKDFLGATRVQDLDPVKDSTSPQWGSWSLAAPTTNADGTRRVSYIIISFTVRAGGTPGDYKLAPRAVSDAVGSDVAGQPVSVHLDAAPDLKVDLSAVPTTLTRDQDVLYRVTVDNFGTGPAANLNVLVILPPGIDFLRTEDITGNASRDQPVDPTPGALVVFYGGFTLPAKTGSGPGAVVITLRGRAEFATGGSFTATAQLTDQDGTVLGVNNGAQVTINAPAAPPSPVPPPATPTPAPASPVAPPPSQPAAAST